MNTELNKEAIVPGKLNAAGNRPRPKKRAKGDKKTMRPSVVYGEEELLAVEEKPFWNAVHDGLVLAILEDGIQVSVTGPNGSELKVFVPDNELLAKNTLQTNASLRIYVDDSLVEQSAATHPITGSEVKAVELDLLERASKAQQKRETLDAYVISPIKGGYSLALFAKDREQAELGFGLRAFLPFGRTTLRRDAGLSETDHIVSVQISELDLSRGNIVVSRRELLAEERKKDEEEFYKNHQIGDSVSGKVSALMPYGVFVNLGAVDGFLHVSDISWDKKPRLNDLVPVGKEITAQIIGIDKENKRVKLSLKELNVDPWQNIDKTCKPGTEVEGTIVAFADFGAFVRLKDGVEGLIHVGEISWNRIKHPSQRFKIGDHIKAAVLRVDKVQRRISLSTKAIELSPVERLSAQFPIGTVLKTKVASIHDFGIFVELDEESQGLVPRSEISWHRSEEPLDEKFSVGQEIEVAVLGYDSNRQRVSCSIKRLNEDPWNKWKSLYKRGSVHKVKVASVSRAGIVCTLDGDLTAFCPRSQLSEGENENTKLNVRVGDTIEIVVTAIDTMRQRISVSQKAAVESETKQAYENYLHEQSRGGGRTTLGDAFKKLDLNKGRNKDHG